MTTAGDGPTVAVTAPVRLSDRAIPEVVLEAGFQKSLDIAGPLEPVCHAEDGLVENV